MKKYIIIIVLAITAIGFVACKKVTDITLNKSELLLIPNETEMLIATVYPDDASNKKTTWKSDNPEVATVDNNGKVTAIADGEAIITVSIKNSRQTAACLVSVGYSKFIEEVTGDWEFIVVQVKYDEIGSERIERERDTIYYLGKMQGKSSSLSIRYTENYAIITSIRYKDGIYTINRILPKGEYTYLGQFEGREKVIFKYGGYTEDGIDIDFVTGTKKKGEKK